MVMNWWLMVIDDFDFVGVPVFPDEADAPLVIDADAVPARQIALEGFKPVAGWHSQVTQIFRCRELGEFAKGDALNVGGKPPGAFALPNLLCLFAAKFLNHFFAVYDARRYTATSSFRIVTRSERACLRGNISGWSASRDARSPFHH